MKILCCGDSHTNVFNYCNSVQKDFVFEVCFVPGATAQGTVNPNSKTNALKVFTKRIKDTQADKLLIMLGEVDCGYLIWVRAKREKISVDEQINICINNLFTFLENVLETNKNYKNEDIILAGAILPTIKDSTDKKYLYGARSEVDVSQKERTNKTIEYNNLLKNKCKTCGYKYIDITSSIIGINDVVNDHFLTTGPADHHLDNKRTHHLWISQLKNIFGMK